MKMFSDCCGGCKTCKIHYQGGCLAGHGDDDYVYASPEWIEQFNSGQNKRGKMAKKKVSEERDLFAEIASETGGDILGDLESIKYFIDTGNLAINYTCCGKFIGGGLPGGRITEIYGPSSSGKSLIASNVLFGAQKLGGWPVLLDCENASNAEFMEKTSHLNLRKVIRQTPKTLEQVFLKIYNVARKIRAKEKQMGSPRTPIVFVYDSITVSPCERELREAGLPDDYKKTDWKTIVGNKEQPGERAKVCSKEFRKLNSMLEKEDISVVVLNQTRSKIGIMFGNPETTGGGGNALEFYASLRLRTQGKKKIEDKRLNTFAGVNMQIRNVKNRTFRPFVSADDIKLYFKTGIDPLSGLLQCLIEDERIVLVSSGNYKVANTYLPEGKEEYKFRATKGAGTVPEQVLVDCPKLVDAEAGQQVTEYLDAFRLAMASSQSEDLQEKEAAYDADGNALFDEEEMG
jgi:recombination protein RecA